METTINQSNIGIFHKSVNLLISSILNNNIEAVHNGRGIQIVYGCLCFIKRVQSPAIMSAMFSISFVLNCVVLDVSQ